MKNVSLRTFLIIVLVIFLNGWNAKSQDTLNNTKLGIKIINETDFNKQYPNHDLFEATNLGFQLVQQIHKSKYSFETGIYFMQRLATSNIPTLVNIGHPNGGIISQYALINYNYLISCNYFSIPCYLRYDPKYVYLSAGPNFDLLSSKTVQNSDPSINPSDSGNGPHLSFNLNIGIDINITKNLILFLEARLNIQSSISEHNLFPNNFSNYGFGFGLEYEINTRKNNHK